MKVLLIIPAYNCEKQIVRVIRSLNKEIADQFGSIAIIDNLSRDSTFEAAIKEVKELQRPIRVLRNAENIGLGGTHKAGFYEAIRSRYDYMAILHGDDQGVTAELLKLLDVARNDPSLSAVLGARFMSGSKLIGYSIIRTLGNRAINLLFSIVSARQVYDLGSGINLFRISDIDFKKINSFQSNLAFNIDLLLYYLKERKKIKFVPISWREEDQISNARCFHQGIEALKTLFRWRLGIAEIDRSLDTNLLASTFADNSEQQCLMRQPG